MHIGTPRGPWPDAQGHPSEHLATSGIADRLWRHPVHLSRGAPMPVPRSRPQEPTRLFSDIGSLADFGRMGWPRFDSRDYYVGPLPKECGHRHKQRMIGKNRRGGFHTSDNIYVCETHICSPGQRLCLRKSHLRRHRLRFGHACLSTRIPVQGLCPVCLRIAGKVSAHKYSSW